MNWKRSWILGGSCSPGGSEVLALLPRAVGAPSLEVPAATDGAWAAELGGTAHSRAGAGGYEGSSNPTIL